MRIILKNFLRVVISCFFSVLFCLFSFGCSINEEERSSQGMNGESASMNSSGSSEPTEKPALTVLLVENSAQFKIVGENPVSVTEGEDAYFVLTMREDFCVDRILRKGETIDAEITNESDGTTKVIIHNIRYSMFVEAECGIAVGYLSYYPNGGTYISGDDPALPYTVGHALKSRLRPNTEIGTDRIERSGYVLNGWNTETDGSGKHIGLGSRVSLVRNQRLELYAEWEKELSSDDFLYTRTGNGITIFNYVGKERRVVVPATIDEFPVRWIDRRTFSGDIKTVILPNTIESVADGAFYNCDICELYFYDNITLISDDAFINCDNFSTVHINAILSPRYGRKNLSSEINFADKYDLLILNADRKKVIVFGGSGAYMSIDTWSIESELNETFDEDYVCINMATNGWFNAAAQFDMMFPYLKEGDTFLHVPETSSSIAFLYKNSMTPWNEDFNYNKLRLYYCLESNYDLLSLVDVRHTTDLLNGFSDFNAMRQSLEPTSYTDYLTKINFYGKEYMNDLGYIDGRGNFALSRDKDLLNVTLDAGEADIVSEYVTDEVAYNRLNYYYDKMAEMGLKVFFITAPVNRDTLLLRMKNPSQFEEHPNYLFYGRPLGVAPLTFTDLDEWVSDFENAVETYLHCEVLVPLSKTIYAASDFFDSDYHLCDKTIPIYTGMIADALKSALYKYGESI